MFNWSFRSKEVSDMKEEIYEKIMLINVREKH